MTNPTSIVQLADVKFHLNIVDNTTDMELQSFIDAATPIIEKITGPVIRQTFVEYFDGGTTQLLLGNLPLISITSITEVDGDELNTLTAITLGSGTTQYGYTVDPERGRIVRRVNNAEAYFADGVQNIKVTYVAGYADGAFPKNVRLATLNLIQHWWQQSQMNKSAGRAMYGGDDVSAMVGGWAIPNRVRELLQPDPDLPGIA